MRSYVRGNVVVRRVKNGFVVSPEYDPNMRLGTPYSDRESLSIVLNGNDEKLGRVVRELLDESLDKND